MDCYFPVYGAPFELRLRSVFKNKKIKQRGRIISIHAIFVVANWSHLLILEYFKAKFDSNTCKSSSLVFIRIHLPMYKLLNSTRISKSQKANLVFFLIWNLSSIRSFTLIFRWKCSGRASRQSCHLFYSATCNLINQYACVSQRLHEFFGLLTTLSFKLFISRVLLI